MEIKLWKENRLDQEWSLDSLEIARRFWESQPNGVAGPLTLERALRNFIGGRDGLNSVWDMPEDDSNDDVFDAIFADVMAARPR